jgi:WD40 repeat protein
MKKFVSAIIVLFLAGCSNAPTIITNTLAPEQPVSTSTIVPIKSPVQTSTPAPSSTPANPHLDFGSMESGQYILYQIDKAGKVSLSALSPYTGKIYSLYDANYPVRFELSPSLNRLALVRNKQVELIDLKTGLNKTINFEYVCNDATWSPDESKLAVVCGEVFIISFSDLNIFQLTDLFTTHGSEFSEVSWSPDEKWLAYNNVADPYGDDPYDGVYITDTTCLSAPANCKEQTKFFSGLLYQFVSSTWSPDSSKLAFLALASIFVVDIDSMKMDPSIELPYKNIYDFTGLAWSLDGSQFAVSNESTQRISVISSRDGKEAASFPIAGTVLSWITVP